jgi:hypothetical protein
MEPSENQFKKPPQTIFRKGEDESELRSHALAQHLEEQGSLRGKSSKEVYDYESERGITGAKNVVTYNPTVKEATDMSSLRGPVSGAALAKLGVKKREAKATKEKEMKRR